jgi:glycogen debranching enzyme
LDVVDAEAPMVGITAPPVPTPRSAATDPRIQRLADRAFSDLNSLRMAPRALPDEVFLAAGAPWFYTLFGRDSLIAARMLLPVDRTLASGTLRVLAARQGRVMDPDTAEQPGKILHEVRRTDLSLDRDGGFHLPPLYYGTIDATPLWVTLLHDTWRAGMPDAEVAALLDNLEAALAWLDQHGDSDDDGFLEYLDTSGHGLANQGWKDSGDSIRWHDGTIAEGPIALCEVQAYAYQAAIHGAAVLDAFDRPGGDRWRGWAAALRERFRSAFWCEDEQGAYPALALDASKRPVDGISSNIGHLLGTGLLDGDERRSVVARLLDPTMFTGYGIRTLSATNGAYWPLRYHAGSVWTHDTAMTIDGLLRDGFEEQAARVAMGLLTAAEAFDYRLPELFGGHSADEVWPPTPYPASCRPQAWAAAAVVPIARALGALP